MNSESRVRVGFLTIQDLATKRTSLLPVDVLGLSRHHSYARLASRNLPPSGVEFSASLNLTPATIEITATHNTTIRHEFAARVLCNVVVARSNLLRVFESEKGGQCSQGHEAVEGEVAMDGQGEGFVNIAKFISQKSTTFPPTVTRFYFVREHRLHGIITGLEGVKVATSHEDKLDKLLVSFKDAKIALLEWSDSIHDLVAVSIHTYERAPQLHVPHHASCRYTLSLCRSPLPKDAIAILPFHQSQAELDAMDQDVLQARDLPYSPSFILDLQSDVDQNMRNVIDFVFLPGFNNPTIAILFQTQETWTGRLKEFKDTVRLVIFTLDIISQNYRSSPPSKAFPMIRFHC
ncbi:hypothetical protein BD779DRAFT_1673102 [Infundibulicybe gibba]|nr:hypothetical protein BD779DRAFT_1673102 [Infundibulicybe gibba]